MIIKNVIDQKYSFVNFLLINDFLKVGNYSYIFAALDRIRRNRLRWRVEITSTKKSVQKRKMLVQNMIIELRIQLVLHEKKTFNKENKSLISTFAMPSKQESE